MLRKLVIITGTLNCHLKVIENAFRCKVPISSDIPPHIHIQQCSYYLTLKTSQFTHDRLERMKLAEYVTKLHSIVKRLYKMIKNCSNNIKVIWLILFKIF